MVMGYQMYSGNGLLDGLSTGVGLRKVYDEMKRQRGLASGMAKVANGDESGWAEVAANSPETYLNYKKQEWERQHANDITPYQQAMIDLKRQELADKDNRTTNMRDFEYFMSLTPEQQEKYNELHKSGETNINLSPYEKTLQMEQAKNRAETEQKAAALEAGLPAFEEMAKGLNTIGKDVSYTKPQQARDWVVRQLGMGATKGAAARERYKQMVANELLPKLRETFGGQLSDAEREALLATLGNVDLAPEEREQAVASFIESKRRQLDGYKRQLGEKVETKEENVVDWRDL